MYDNRSIEEVKNLIISGLQQEFNNKLKILPKSFIKVISTVFAAVFIILFKQIGWFFLQLFPDTAYWGEVNIFGLRIRPLVRWGILKGVGVPRNGSQWRGRIKVDVTMLNSFLDGGTQLKSDITGKIYLTDQRKVLENDTEIIPVTCVESGSIGNIEPGEILYFVNPLANVKKETEVFDIVYAGADAETETEYRNRVVNRWKVQPQGGALVDYWVWSLEVESVLNVYPYLDQNSASGILLFVAGNPGVFPDRIPDRALMIQVGDSCTYDQNGKAYRKPMGAVLDPAGDRSYLNILPVVIIKFNISVFALRGVSAIEFLAVVKPVLKEWLWGREPFIRGLSDENDKKNIVSKNSLSSIIYQVAYSMRAEFDSVEMYKNGIAILSYTLSMGELCDIGIVTVNGVQN